MIIGITGITGLLGLNLAIFNEIYLKKKYKIIGIAHKKKINYNKLNYVFNLSKKNLKEKILKYKITHIVHCAAITDVEYCEINREKALNTNFNFTKKIVDISKELSLNLIFISTDQLFNGLKINKYTEKDKPSPLNIYSLTKYLSEKYVIENLKNYKIVRTSFFGDGTSYRASYSDWIISNMLKKNKLYLSDNIKFTPIHIIKLSEIIFKLLSIDINGIYNVSSDHLITKYKFGILIANVFDLDRNLISKSEIDNHLIKRPHNMALNNHKIKKLLNINIIDNKEFIKKISKSMIYSRHKNEIKKIKIIN